MRTYKSTIGWEILLPVLLLIGILLYFNSKDTNWLGILVLCMLLAFFYYLFTSTLYTIHDAILTVKCGVFVNESVPIDRIQKIKHVTNFMAAPATSIKRLEIRYNDTELILISPQHQSAFIKSLLQINPTIELVQPIESNVLIN